MEGVDLIPADPRLSKVSVEKMPTSNNIRENNRKLWDHLSLIRRVLEPLGKQYDYILIDSHPEVSDLLQSVIYAAQYVVSPVKLDLQSTIGVPTAIQVMNEVNADVDMVRRAIGNIDAHPPTVFIQQVDGGLLVALINQYRYWTPNRARLLGAELVREHLDVFEA